jgi:hypothetical protein
MGLRTERIEPDAGAKMLLDAAQPGNPWRVVVVVIVQGPTCNGDWLERAAESGLTRRSIAYLRRWVQAITVAWS